MGHSVVRPGGPSRLRAALAVTAAVMWLAVPAPARPAGASTPPHPAGTSARALVPHVYPGGGLVPFGDARGFGSPAGALGADKATAVFATADGAGYWVATAAGVVYNYGDATADGSMAGTHLNAPVIAASGW